MASDDYRNPTHLVIAPSGRQHRSLLKKILRFPFNSWRISAPPADHFLIVPQDLRTADPSFATEVYHGHFGLAGTLAVTDSRSPFSVSPPNESWERELHGFSWLRHLRASEDDLARDHSRSMVQDWIHKSESAKGIIWEPAITARRLISWLAHAPLVLDGASQDEYDNVMRSITKQLRFLEASYKKAADGEARITILIALVLCGLCLSEQDYLVDNFSKILCDELNRQIYPDGCHISRNPNTNIELLLDLLPLKQCFVVRDRKPPAELIAATNRMLPMIRFLRLGDGYMARFNGMGATLPDALATVLAYDESYAQPSGQARESGYARMANGSSIVLIDAGTPPPIDLSSQAHAGCLSFEISSGTIPIIVNCGAPGPAHQEWRLNAKATANHSTVTIFNASSSQLLKPGFFNRSSQSHLLSGPANVDAELRSSAKGDQFLGSHNGYLEKHGVTHVRKLQLDASGTKLQGEDHLVAGGGRKRKTQRHGKVPFAIHFHIHPAVQVTRTEKDDTILLKLPNDESWTLTSPHLSPSLEESMFLADYREPRQTLQIVLRGTCTKEARIRWTLEKITAKTELRKKVPHLISNNSDEKPISEEKDDEEE